MKKFYKVKQEELLKYSDLFKEDDVILPKRQTVGSCGYDFYMPYDYVLKANSNGKVYSGIKIELGFDEFLMLCIRSSLAIKKGITLTNQVGIIDSDYFNNIDNDGHIIIAITNNTNEYIILKKGERLAQGIICKYYKTDDDETGENRYGGIGSTTKYGIKKL